MSRLAVLLALVLALAAAAAPAALAQGGDSPFGPLPPAQPQETPPPEPVDAAGDDGDVSRTTLFLIALGVIAVFVGIGWAITRDARRALPADDRREVERGAQPAEAGRRHDRRVKQKARSKQKAARAARKTTRRRTK